MARILNDKVVVISGVGPALGTTLAGDAEAGADLVLAARTVERLDDVAKQITDMGRRAVAVGTDITDEDQVRNSSSDAGRVRQGRRADQQRLPGAVDEAVGQHHVRAHARRDRADGVRCAAADPGLHARARRVEGVGGQRELDGHPPLAGQVRRLQDGEVGAAGDVAVAGHRTRRAGYPSEFRCAGLYLGWNAEELLQPPGRQVRHQVDEIYKPPPPNPTSSGCPPRTRWRRRFCSWPATCPAASPGRRSTSTAGSTKPDGPDRRRHRRRTARVGDQGVRSRRLRLPTTTTIAKHSACCSSPTGATPISPNSAAR